MTQNLIKQKLRNKAVSYLSRYATSASHLKVILEQYIFKQGIAFSSSEEKQSHIDETIVYLKKINLLNDELYALTRARGLFRKGKSTTQVKYDLRDKNIENSVIDTVLETLEEELSDIEYQSALKFLKKRRALSNRAKDIEADKLKNLQKLLRAGFNRDVANKAINTLLDPSF